MLHTNAKEMIENAVNTIRPDAKIFIDRNFAMSDLIHKTLTKQEKDVAWLADQSGLDIDLIQDFLTGIYDISLRDVAEMEAALGIQILEIKR